MGYYASGAITEQLVELKNAYEAYFTAFNNYTTDFYEKRLNESRVEILKDLNLCLIRITNAVASLAKSIDSGQPIIIGEANSILIEIIGIRLLRLLPYNQIQEKDNLLVDIHPDLIACVKAINDDIVLKYNGAHEQILYTIEEAFVAFTQNTPSDFADLL